MVLAKQAAEEAGNCSKSVKAQYEDTVWIVRRHYPQSRHATARPVRTPNVLAGQEQPWTRGGIP
ncbi:MAG: hypothetical protein UR53_C0001G0017 [Candidatus Magasanikbacteria bacterium GW2011_GWC2_34_16]|uniref:Uncharacterized protein n=2 Tax=Candidatus Magasanikiibacteriota TaxID=1752731 RepID=A0A0G0JVT2_9BACT|nr:MAG: hypothetical protein UR53_C0001G0017 [Candidatus Magasanikbacteria bacterium GW2011_GWC2_34_16]KKQ41034.1 MAG: hypothetical protein US58_C0006G0013 [Candidatus Magasanikbacteria bacterium GW2011_GWA2_37_8]